MGYRQNHNDKRKEQLGIYIGTAQRRLMKLLLFKYIKKAGENYCCRCLQEIKSSDDMSMDHLKDWMNSIDPERLFFDLDNIAFSHLNCNCKANKYGKRKHPGLQAYRRGCRCNECKRIASEKRTRLKIEKLEKEKSGASF